MRVDNDYKLTLAGGHGWHLIGTEQTKPWLDEMAAIMELKPAGSEKHPRLIFVPRENTDERFSVESIRGLTPEISDSLPRAGWKAHEFIPVIFRFHDNVPDVICEIDYEEVNTRYILSMWNSVHPVYHLAQRLGGAPFHAALVERDGVGVLLAGSSGAGKSTSCSRIPAPWSVWCDDETLVVPNGSGYVAHPFPTWSDYILKRPLRTWDVEQHLPLAAIFFLEQATTDEVYPIGQGEAAVLINRSTPDEALREWIIPNHADDTTYTVKYFNNACEIARAVPAYSLRATLHGKFWEEMEKVL